MTYELVEIEEIKVIGIQDRTSNLSENMKTVIGGLWQKFYGQGIYESIPGKVNDKALGIYTEYAANEFGEYTIVVGCQVENLTTTIPETSSRIIPAGKYAKFIIQGDLHQAIASFWEELWKMDLPRSFQSDFEEYQNGDPANAEIHVYIGLK